MNPQVIQRDYYSKTAEIYDGQHVDAEDEHLFALRHIAFYLDWIGAERVLDTGCGTGRAMVYLKRALPALRVHGNDPSQALLDVALAKHGIPPEALDCVASEQLPYPDASFDSVVETGVLHHVSRPDEMVKEMLRVARTAVFLSVTNIYGRGARLSRLTKLGLSRLRLLKTVNRIRRGGEEWFCGVGDGVAYSYSVFDSYPIVLSACSQVVVIPTSMRKKDVSVCPPLQTSHVLLCGFKSKLPAVFDCLT